MPPGAPRRRPWWHAAVGYEVYLRSFADGDGDGVGDLPGLLAHLDHLADLGIGIVWLTPFYPSPMRDHGYDVADYTGVDPTFGTIADLDAVLARAHALGMRVIIDLVPNHTSSEHPWFVASRSSREDPLRERYLWRDGRDGGPPNNWTAQFGGDAWTYDEVTDQWWCHLFLPEQPDLNWADEGVREAFDDVLRFWLDRGVDGFRIDVAHGLVKHPDLPDNPPARTPPRSGGGTGWGALEHVHDIDQPGVLDIYRRWREVVAPYDALLIGEVYLLDAPRLARYVADQDGLHLTFWFSPLHVEWDAASIRQVLASAVEVAPDQLAWVLASHDRPRPPTRFGGGERGRRRALALSTLLFGLPGVPFLYQGEELGLEDGEVPPERAVDPLALGDPTADSRDGCRTPLPWAPGPGWGFTSADDAWLPFGDRTAADTVAVQREDPTSPLHRYRRLIAVRRETPALLDEPIAWLDARAPVVAYRRGNAIVAANCGDETADLVLPAGGWTIAFTSSGTGEGAVVEGRRPLAPAEAVIARHVG